MADLLAKQDSKKFALVRGQTVQGTIIAINPTEITMDLGTKSEGVLQKRDLSVPIDSLKIGDSLEVMVVVLENESGQTIVTTKKYIPTSKNQGSFKWDRFDQALASGQTITGRGIEVNKGGLIVEAFGTRGFLPASQVSLSQASDLEDLVGKDLTLSVIEVDPNQNRLIFSHKTDVSDTTKKELGKLQIRDKVSGKVAAVLPFGIFVSLDQGVEGLVHVSEVAWEKVEDLPQIFKVGDPVEALVSSVDINTGRVNLSIKQLAEDPFIQISKKYAQDKVVQGKVFKISNLGVVVTLEDGVEGLIPSSKTEAGVEYQAGQSVNCLIDNIDSQKRRINLVPFVTTTKGLIYK